MNVTVKASKKGLYLNIIFIMIVAVFIIFNISSTLKYFDIDRKTEILGLQPYNYEKVLYGFSFLERDQNGKYFRWSGDESDILVRARGEIMFIPLFNSRPDISTDPVNILIFIDGEMVANVRQEGNDLSVTVIDLRQLGIKKGEYVELKFISDKTWTPKDYGISDDTREISFALSEIGFED